MKRIYNLSQAAEFLKENDNFIILTHVYPDGDTLGSAYALCGILQQMGKNAVVKINGELGSEFLYLRNGIEKQSFEFDKIISVDVADSNLLGELKIYADRVDLAIDHHIYHREFADIYYVDGDAAANCEIIYKLGEELGISFTKNICNAVYTGICTDTGCFKYINVTPETHIIAADLMKKGCDAAFVNREMFEKAPRSKKELEAFVICNMEYYKNGEIAFAYVTTDILEKFGVNINQLGSISAVPRTIEGVKVGVTLKQENEKSFKISLRTNDGINAAEICSKFGGGGHKAAAGCTLLGSKEDVRDRLIDVISGYLD